MLRIKIVDEEHFDDEKQEFVETSVQILEFEHSLASLSKWESIWCKPFLSDTEKTDAEIQSYIECMLISPGELSDAIFRLSSGHVKQINDYLNQKMTATWFNDKKSPKSREVITSEVIYFWMISLKIPFECERWHLNRLFTLIKVCNEKNSTKKLTRSELVERNRLLNEQRRAALGSKG